MAKYRVPLTVVVFNNRAYMAVKNQFRGSEERVRIAAEMGAEITGPDLNFARLAETFGIHGQRVEQPDAIEPALKRALEQNGPALVDVVMKRLKCLGIVSRSCEMSKRPSRPAIARTVSSEKPRMPATLAV